MCWKPVGIPAVIAFRRTNVTAEDQESLTPDIAQTLINRFTPAHHLNFVQDDGQRRLEAPPPWFLGLSHLHQLLATWEWRSGPTPWLVRGGPARLNTSLG